MKDLTLFECSMRLFLGDKAFGIANLANNPKERNKWIKKVLEKMMVVIDTMETSEKHKQKLLYFLEEVLQNLDEHGDISYDAFFYLLCFCGHLLGFVNLTGGIYRNILYYQNDDQYYATVHHEGGDRDREYFNDKKDIGSIRPKLVVQLKAEGFSNFKIAKILNITQYQVTQLKNQAKHYGN